MNSSADKDGGAGGHRVQRAGACRSLRHRLAARLESLMTQIEAITSASVETSAKSAAADIE